MELKQLTERVFYTTHSKEADRPVLGYISGQKYSLMVDSGNSRRHVELFNDSITNEGLRKPDFIAITHWHWDHTFGYECSGRHYNCSQKNEC
ncbi:MBL fold metallo-hydrolase [Desulfosporosinus sp. PR]|uniref:MBL fold metallo-hydrolase n=1 Tax=Candidatus Desulfosporosinus nitrosoreducens TaxID=3401928 RepID=UPI0027F6663B|nr:MBL fold metallo-hydrolase [Desulfosporosinus sp. PR]MDQ7094400.1 MBL fold metallo-hydrolase [Desulfosporosinus sp. PR]